MNNERIHNINLGLHGDPCHSQNVRKLVNHNFKRVYNISSVAYLGCYSGGGDIRWKIKLFCR